MRFLRSEKGKCAARFLSLGMALFMLAGCKNYDDEFYDYDKDPAEGAMVVIADNDGYRHFGMLGDAIDFSNGDPGGYVQLTSGGENQLGSVFCLEPIQFAELAEEAAGQDKVRKLTLSFDFLIGTQDYGEDAAAPTWFVDGEGITVSLSRQRPDYGNYTLGSGKMGYKGFAGVEVDVSPSGQGDPENPHIAILGHTESDHGETRVYGDGDLTRSWHHLEFQFQNNEMNHDNIVVTLDGGYAVKSSSPVDVPYGEKVFVNISAATSHSRASTMTISNVNINGKPVVFGGIAYRTFDTKILTRNGWTTNPDGYIGYYGSWITNPAGEIREGSGWGYREAHDDVQVVFREDGNGYWHKQGYYGIMKWWKNGDGTVAYEGWGAKPVRLNEYLGDEPVAYYHMASYTCQGLITLEGDEETGYTINMSNPLGDEMRTAYVPIKAGNIGIDNKLYEKQLDLLYSYEPYELISEVMTWWSASGRQHWNEEVVSQNTMIRVTEFFREMNKKRYLHLGVFHQGQIYSKEAIVDGKGANGFVFDAVLNPPRGAQKNVMSVSIDRLPGNFECSGQSRDGRMLTLTGRFDFDEVYFTVFVTRDGVFLAVELPDPGGCGTDYIIHRY